MIDLYLRAVNRESMVSGLVSAGFHINNEAGNLQHPRVLLDEIGLLFTPTGEIMKTEDGYDYPVLAQVDGWHANLRVLDDELAVAFKHLCCDCKTPSRVWA